jgi:hypothetical protein
LFFRNLNQETGERTMVDPISAIASSEIAETAKTIPRFKAETSFSMGDVARFEASMSPEANTTQVGAVQLDGATQSVNPAGIAASDDSAALRAVFDPLDKINSMSENFLSNVEALSAKTEISPGEMLMSMVNVQKFMLQCQAASSVANRTSDGIQELFKQQS